jgi:DNA-binding transcriptional LysR family regulator
MESEVEALQRGVGTVDSAAAGRVRLTAVPTLVNRLIVPAVPRFHAAHPLVRLELIAEPHNVSLSRCEADVALRLSRPERAGASLVRRIGMLDYAAYGPVGAGADKLPWIGYEEGFSHLRQAQWIATESEAGSAAPVAVNDAEAIFRAIYAGLGKSLLPCLFADADERLRRLSTHFPLTREIWLLTHRELRRQKRIEAVIEWLQALFQRPPRPRETPQP